MIYQDTSVLDARNEDGETPTVIYDPETGDPLACVFWRSSDGWRGHYDTEPIPDSGWKKVGEGTNCGSWEDTPPGTSNDECQAYVEELEAEHGTVLLVALPTSNVFAIGFDVYAREER